MLKKYGPGLLLIIILLAGLRYVYYSAPELPDSRLFNTAIREFSKNAAPMENEFVKKQRLPQFNNTLSLKYISSDQEESMISLYMTSRDNRVTLTFGQGQGLLAEKTVIMEPYFSNNELNLASVRWKCIGGTVLLRLRSKACRLGYGIDTREINAL